MNEHHEGGSVAVKEVVEKGMSRCLFGDWPRRALLKVTLPACDGTSPFLIPRKGRDQNTPASVSQVGA